MFMARCLINPPSPLLYHTRIQVASVEGRIYRAPDVVNLRTGSWQQSVVLEPTSAAGLGRRRGRENIYKKGRKRKGK